MYLPQFPKNGTALPTDLPELHLSLPEMHLKWKPDWQWKGFRISSSILKTSYSNEKATYVRQLFDYVFTYCEIKSLVIFDMQPSTFELAKREDFGSLPTVPSDFIRKHGATYSGEHTQYLETLSIRS